ALLVERFRPRQHGDLNSTRAEVLEIFRVSGLPNSGQIRLAIRGLRSRRRAVRLSVRGSRNPRSGIVQPLRGEWSERREKDDQSQNRSRTRHVGLPLDTLYTLLRYTSKYTIDTQPGRARRSAMRSSADIQPASNAQPGASISTTSGAWSEGIGFPLRASRSISAQTTRGFSEALTSR